MLLLRTIGCLLPNHEDSDRASYRTRVRRGRNLKWFLAIPHYVVLIFLWLAATFVGIFARFAILFTGRFPRGAFEFIEGVLRWEDRVVAYAFVLATDEYPPFRLSP